MAESSASKQLIQLIENKALEDTKSIDVSQEEEAKIDLPTINTWYLETEKLIRILANLLPSTMAQPINQLRYAGHHILKASLEKTEEKSKKANLIEAYKHCKRGYYDAIDLYVFHTNSLFKSKLAYLPKEKVKEYSGRLKIHLEEINAARFQSPCRIDYYSEVSKTLSSGLSIINDINETMSEHGITEEELKSQRKLFDENKSLIEYNQKLKNQIQSKLERAEKTFNRWAVFITILVVVVTSVGMLFDGYFTQSLLKSHMQLNITDAPVIKYQDLDKIKK